MEDQKIENIKTILTNWNPLGSSADQIDDLNDYETEASDMLYHIDSGREFPKHGNPQTRIQKIIKGILNEAFDLSLTDEECKEPAIKIMNVMSKK